MMSSYSHPFYQDYLWKKVCGTNFHFDNYHMHWRFIYIVWAILIFFTYPLVIIIDIIFGKNDILFLSPEMKELEEKSSDCCFRENRVMAYYRKVMHRPVFRIVVHHFMELVFLVTISLSALDPLDKPLVLDVSFYDYAAGITRNYRATFATDNVFFRCVHSSLHS